MICLLPYGYILRIREHAVSRWEVYVRVYSVADVAAAVRGRRIDRGLSQSELAERCGVSRKWISEFEAGKATAEFALVLRVLEELGLMIELSDVHAGIAMSAGGTMSARAEVTPPLAERPWDLDELLEEYRGR
jgi:y4mF family transcriptional regulator